MIPSYYQKISNFDELINTLQDLSQDAQTISGSTKQRVLSKIPKFLAQYTLVQKNDISDKQWEKLNEVFSNLMFKIPPNQLTNYGMLAYEVEKYVKRKFLTLPSELKQFHLTGPENREAFVSEWEIRQFSSKELSSLFCGKFKESKEREVNFSCLSLHAFDVVVRHLKNECRIKERMNINREQFVEIAKFAQMYVVISLLSVCDNWLVDHMNKCKYNQEKLSPIQFYEKYIQQFNQPGTLKFLKARDLYIELKYKDGTPVPSKGYREYISYYLIDPADAWIKDEKAKLHFDSLNKNTENSELLFTIANFLVKSEIRKNCELSNAFFKFYVDNSIYFNFEAFEDKNKNFKKSAYKAFFSATERLAIFDRFEYLCFKIDEFKETEEKLVDTIDTIIECCPMQNFPRKIMIDCWYPCYSQQERSSFLDEIKEKLKYKQNQKEQNSKFIEFEFLIRRTTNNEYTNNLPVSN